MVTAVGGLMAVAMPPAQATTTKTITITGIMTLRGGAFGFPCTPNKPCPPATTTTVKPDAKGVPSVNFTMQNGNHAEFDFNTTTLCVKTSASTPTKTTQKGGAPAQCRVSATGSIWGWCELATGLGTATITNLSNNKSTITTAIKFTWSGPNVHITGGNNTTNITGDPAMAPEPAAVGGPSCTNKTATRFTIAGNLIYKDTTL